MIILPLFFIRCSFLIVNSSLFIIILSHMGNTTSALCNYCLASQPSSGQYAYESYKKIPFFGTISDYLKLIKTGGQGSGGSGFFGTITGFIGNAIGGQSQPAGGQVAPPGPQQQQSFMSMLINSLPINSVKAGQNNILDLVSDDSVVKKIKKSNYQELIKKYQESPTQNFTDNEFPPTAASLGSLEGEDLSKIGWKRIADIIQDPIFVKDKIQAADILQGSLGDCYFLSALSALAEQEYRIRNLFASTQINKNGFYMAKILHNGIYQEVVIDDYFPVDEKGKVYFAQPAAGKQIWVMILEKCWAKLYGSYSSIVGGLPDEVLHAFSGAPTLYRPIKAQKEKQQQLWNQMVVNFKNGALLCCGTKGDASIQSQGFVRGHAYTILGVYETPFRLIKLRNPWGRKQWKGNASDYDNNFWAQISPADKQMLDYNDDKRKTNTDGVFFILWDDFIKYYQLVDICKINDNASYNFNPVTFDHLAPKLFEIEIKEDSQVKRPLTIALTQQSSRGRGQDIQDRGYSRSFIALGKLNPQSNKYEYVLSNSAKTFPDNYMQLQHVTPGKYLMYSKYLWNNGKKSNVSTVSAYSPSATNLKEIDSSNYPNFLKDIFYDHALKNNTKKKVLNSGPSDWICSDMLLNGGGFGYLVVNLDSSSGSKLGVELNEGDYVQKKISWLNPFQGKGLIKEEVVAGKPFIMVLEMPVQAFPQSVTLPIPKVSQLQ